MLAAAGTGLCRLYPSLLDIGRNFRLAADKTANGSADSTSAEPVLRGTVYDRGLQELAVSYLLYSVRVRPREIVDPDAVVQALSEATGRDPEELENALGRQRSSFVIADNLEREEIEPLVQGELAGVYVQPEEQRFYPEHETASALVGYTSDGIGLAGVEGAYDMFLQHGEFRTSSLPEIDFEGQGILGRMPVDIILTLDLGLQKKVEKKLEKYLADQDMTRGLAIVLDAKSGAVLAWAETPGYNPNYYWREASWSENRLASEALVPELYRDLAIRAEAIRESGETGAPLLPVTIAAPGLGLEERPQMWFARLAGTAAAPTPLPDSMVQPDQNVVGPAGNEGLSPLQLARVTAAMVNGGRMISPHVLASVYDHSQGKLYGRSQGTEGAQRYRIASPALGIRLKRELLVRKVGAGREYLSHAASVSRIVRAGGRARFVMRNLFVGAVPARAPSKVLLMVGSWDTFAPRRAARRDDAGVTALVDAGAELLVQLDQHKIATVAGRVPPDRDQANYNQFLISRRVDFRAPERLASRKAAVMPELTGLSLRKGLQRLNPYHLTVRIKGSGRIVDQEPAPGELLRERDECVLKLASRI